YGLLPERSGDELELLVTVPTHQICGFKPCLSLREPLSLRRSSRPLDRHDRNIEARGSPTMLCQPQSVSSFATSQIQGGTRLQLAFADHVRSPNTHLARP